jgi:tetratricopeptide (TPR) repeat protein
MRLKIQFMVPACLCALILVSSSYGAEDLAEQIKQAERLCVKRQFTDAERIYLNIVQQAADAEQRFSAQRKLAAVYVAQDKQPLATALVQNILSDYAKHERLPHAIHEIAESCHKFGNGIKAKEIYEAILKDQPGHPQKIWLDMGLAISSILAGEPDAGWAATQRLLNDYRTDNRAAEAVGQVAWCYRKQKDFQNARTLYQHVVDTWPGNERAIYSQRGIILTSIELKDANGEKAAIEKLFRDYSRHKDFVNVVSYVAEAYREKWQFKESRELHQYIVDKYPASDQAIWSQRSIVLSNIGLKDDPNTETGIEKLLKDYGGHRDVARVVYQVARSLNWQDDMKAKELYEYVLEKDGGGRFGALAKVNLGGVKLRNGDEKTARADFDKVLANCEGQPVWAEAVHLIAEAYWDQAAWKKSDGLASEHKQYIEKALVEWNRITEKSPEGAYHRAAAYYFSGRCYEKLGEVEKAIERYETLVETWPDYEYSWNAQYLIACSYEWLMRAERIHPREGAVKITDACQKVLMNYPESMAAKPAQIMLKKWIRTATQVTEGEEK